MVEKHGVPMAAILDLIQQALAIVLVVAFLLWKARIKSLNRERRKDTDIER